MSLQTKIALSFTAVLLVAVLAFNVTLSIYLKEAAREDYRQGALRQLADIRQIVSVHYDRVYKLLNFLAEHPLLKQADASITRYVDSGELTMMTPSINGGIEQEIFELFELIGRTDGDLLFVYLGTEDGGYVQWPQTHASVYYDPRVRPWYQASAHLNGAVVHTEPYAYVDLLVHQLLGSISRSFTNQAGEHYGVVAVDFKSDTLSQLVQRIRIGHTGHGMIVHRSGTLLADALNPKNNLKPLEEIGYDDFLAAIQTEVETFQTHLNGVDYQVYQYPEDTAGWVFFGLVDVREIEQAAQTIRRIMFVVSLILLLISIPVSVVLAHALNRKVHQQQHQLNALVDTQKIKTQRQHWLSAAGMRLQQANNLPALIQVFFSYLHQMLHLMQGVMYVVGDEERLVLAGSFSCAEPPPLHLSLGEGLLGQCAIDQRLQVIEVDTERVAMIRSGLGDARPQAIVLAPILLNDSLLGVVELALLKAFDTDDQALFENLLALLALNIEIIGRNGST